MPVSPEPKVFFTCLTCGTLYEPNQIKRSKVLASSIDCPKCYRILHPWFGSYDYVGWSPVMRIKSRPPA